MKISISDNTAMYERKWKGKLTLQMLAGRKVNVNPGTALYE